MFRSQKRELCNFPHYCHQRYSYEPPYDTANPTMAPRIPGCLHNQLWDGKMCIKKVNKKINGWATSTKKRGKGSWKGGQIILRVAILSIHILSCFGMSKLIQFSFCHLVMWQSCLIISLCFFSLDCTICPLTSFSLLMWDCCLHKFCIQQAWNGEWISIKAISTLSSNLLSWNIVHFLLLHYCFLYIKHQTNPLSLRAIKRSASNKLWMVSESIKAVSTLSFKSHVVTCSFLPSSLVVLVHQTSNKPPIFKSYQKSIHVHFTPLVLRALQSNEPPEQVLISWGCNDLEQTQARIKESCYHFASLHRSWLDLKS
jgi:hypothetical protein